MRRRDFLARLAVGGVAAMAATPALRAQDSTSAGPAQGTTSNLFNMDQMAARSVVRPPKPNARPLLTPDQRDALEHQIRCQCGCTLDVYTCRTTDFTCQVSPAMHRDVMALVEGGYSAQEILDAFVEQYGERALMAPKKEGFNLAGYLVPFVSLGAGAAFVVVALRKMQRRAGAVAASGAAAPAPRVDASPEELRKLDDAIRKDG